MSPEQSSPYDSFVAVPACPRQWVAMKLSAREVDKLRLHAAGELAQKRLARGVRLNHAEAAALIASQVSRPAKEQLVLHALLSTHCVQIRC